MTTRVRESHSSNHPMGHRAAIEQRHLPFTATGQEEHQGPARSPAINFAAVLHEGEELHRHERHEGGADRAARHGLREREECAPASTTPKTTCARRMATGGRLTACPLGSVDATGTILSAGVNGRSSTDSDDRSRVGRTSYSPLPPWATWSERS